MTYVAQMQSMGVIRPGNVQERLGISEESFNDIQRRIGGSPQERPATKPTPRGQVTIEQSEVIIRLKEALDYQMVQFDRYRELTERKFTTLSKEVLDLAMQVKQLHQSVAKIKDKEDVAVAREALHKYQQGDRPAMDRPIDRNGVAPKDVQLENIFNFSARR